MGVRCVADSTLPGTHCSAMILLKDHNAETLQEALADLRPPERLVRQLHALAMKHSALEIPAELPNFSKRLLAQSRSL